MDHGSTRSGNRSVRIGPNFQNFVCSGPIQLDILKIVLVLDRSGQRISSFFRSWSGSVLKPTGFGRESLVRPGTRNVNFYIGTVSCQFYGK